MGEEYQRDMTGARFIPLHLYLDELGIIGAHMGSEGKMLCITGRITVGGRAFDLIFRTCRNPEEADRLIGSILECKNATWPNNESSPSTTSEATP
jgi:hypothetical protein